MVFSSPIFIFLFLPVVLAAYFLAPLRAKNQVLLIASFAFYIWGERQYFLLILALTAFNWAIGLAIAAAPALRRPILACGVAVDLAVLFFFKYLNFAFDQLNAAGAAVGLPPMPNDPVHLPIGISFFTFHCLSYVIDVARRTSPAQKNPIDFALYISFFPQMIAGPIIRYHDIAEQLATHRASLEGFADGVERFTLGLAKKLLIANPLGEAADRVFALPAADLSTPTAWVGIAAYGLQIYFDFSGYSDMAIGLGRMFGFRFLENFNYPYVATSVQDFWRRWHISLSNWFRDYLYIPLGGNRLGPARTYLNLVVVFLLCGAWHGASWNFVIWGAIHGAFLALERRFALADRLPRAMRHLYVLLVVFTAWVFFRAETFGGAVTYLQAMAGFGGGLPPAQALGDLGRQTAILLLIGLIGATPAFSWLARDWRARAGQARGVVTAEVATDAAVLAPLRAVVMVALLVACWAALAGQTHNPFIYFRF